MLGERYNYDGRPSVALNELQVHKINELNKAINEGTYSFETVPCSICKTEDHFEVLAKKDRYGLLVPTVICTDCGLVQTNPRMTEESYNMFYRDHYRALYSGNAEPGEQTFNNRCSTGQYILEFLQNNVPDLSFENKRVLEVGCADGGILVPFKSQGAFVQGIDLGDDYLAYGRNKHGLNIASGTIDTIKHDKPFDIIIYNHVLEHILDPDKELQHVRNLLADDGYLFVCVPGSRYLHEAYKSDLLLYLQNAHVYHFSLWTLARLLQNNDFKMLAGDERIAAIFQKQPADAEKVNIPNDYTNAMKYFFHLDAMRRNMQFSETTA